MKKINCSFCFKNFMQVLSKSICPYCGKEVINEEFVKCKPIEVIDFDIKERIYDDIDDDLGIKVRDDIVDIVDEIDGIEDDTDDEIIDTEDDDGESDNEHNEDTESTDE